MADFDVGVPDEIARLSLGHSHADELPSLPASQIKSNGIVAEDITEKFSEAVKTLQPGEIVKDGFFTLFESVAALEIMEPKMDSGLNAEGDELEELYDISRQLLPEEVLGIVDQLICHEMSWHLGYPLSQTLYTSLYVEPLLWPDPATIDDAMFFKTPDPDGNRDPMLQVLRAYCLGMLKACGYVNERVKSEHFYEEEDFVTTTYNSTLLARIPTGDIRSALVDACAILRSTEEPLEQSLRDALLARLELRLIFLDAAESPLHIKEPELVRRPWQEAVDILPLIEATHSLGIPVADAFSPKLQRKLASTMAPRPVVKLEFDAAFGHLMRLFRDGTEMVNVLRYTDSQCLLTFVRTFQFKKPEPLVYIRTLLQTFLFDSMEVLGTMSIRQLLDDDFSIITLPASPYLDRTNDEIEVIPDPRFVMSSQMEIFRQRAAQPFLDVLRTLCQNRCRVRRTLCHVIRDWESLQMDAEEIDQILQVKTDEIPLAYQSSLSSGRPVDSYALSLSSWAYLYKVQLMEEIVQSGFELEVYQADELGGMYWYLNYLAKSRLQHTERIKSFVLHTVERSHRQSTDQDPDSEKQFQRSLAFIRKALLDAAVTWELADALACLYTVLERLQLVRRPVRPFGSDALRYEVRMKPFAAIGLPELPTFEDFVAAKDQVDSTSEELLDYGERAIADAKKALEVMSKFSAEDASAVGSHDRWAASVKNTWKSCIAAGIAINVVQKALSEEDTEPFEELALTVDIPKPNKAYHEWWIVPKILPRIS